MFSALAGDVFVRRTALAVLLFAPLARAQTYVDGPQVLAEQEGTRRVVALDNVQFLGLFGAEYAPFVFVSSEQRSVFDALQARSQGVKAALDRARGGHPETRELEIWARLDAAGLLTSDKTANIYTAKIVHAGLEGPQVGAFAAEPIGRGRFLGFYTGTAAVPRRNPLRGSPYLMGVAVSRFDPIPKFREIGAFGVDGTLRRNVLSHVNHGRDPNVYYQCVFDGARWQMGFFADRSIAAHQQLLIDYDNSSFFTGGRELDLSACRPIAFSQRELIRARVKGALHKERLARQAKEQALWPRRLHRRQDGPSGQ
jgi:hypothetical protein